MDEPAREAFAARGVTRRELDVLDALGDQLSNAEIASRLGLSERTVESHVSSLLRRLGVGGRRDLGRLAGPSTTPMPPLDALPAPLDLARRRSACVGRGTELQRLGECWDAATAGTIVAIVRGEAGIGKSRLVAELAADLHERSGRVLFGACTDDSSRPYEPFVAALSNDTDVPGPRQAADSRDALLERLLRDATGASLRQDVVDPAREQVEVHDAIVRLLGRLARRQRLLLVIEDVHWASEGTRQALLHLAGATQRAPVLVVATSRDDDPSVPASHHTFLARLARLPAVVTVPVVGLDLVAAGELIAAVGGNSTRWRACASPMATRCSCENWRVRVPAADHCRRWSPTASPHWLRRCATSPT